MVFKKSTFHTILPGGGGGMEILHRGSKVDIFNPTSVFLSEPFNYYCGCDRVC